MRYKPRCTADAKSTLAISKMSPITLFLFRMALVATTISNAIANDGSDSIRDGADRKLDYDPTSIIKYGARAGRWAGGVIPYVIGPGFNAQDLANIRLAIDDYHSKTCIRWVERATQVPYATFVRDLDGTGCAYTLGDNMVFENCRNTHTIIHEMGHLVGFPHEQDRADRDTYLGGPGCDLGGKFPDLDPRYKLYDYLSVLHYQCDPNGCPAPKIPGVPYCGQYYDAGRMSVLDAERFNHVYECAGCLAYRFRFRDQITPSQALVAGRDNNGGTTYVCRGYANNGNIYVGVASGNLASCWLPNGSGGEAGLGSGFEVLTDLARNLRWVRSTGVIPANAIKGGRSAAHDTAYIGRCNYPTNAVTPGTILASNPREIRVPFSFAEHICTDFEILVCG